MQFLCAHYSKRCVCAREESDEDDDDEHDQLAGPFAGAFLGVMPRGQLAEKTVPTITYTCQNQGSYCVFICSDTVDIDFLAPHDDNFHRNIYINQKRIEVCVCLFSLGLRFHATNSGMCPGQKKEEKETKSSDRKCSKPQERATKGASLHRVSSSCLIKRTIYFPINLPSKINHCTHSIRRFAMWAPVAPRSPALKKLQ